MTAAALGGHDLLAQDYKATIPADNPAIRYPHAPASDRVAPLTAGADLVPAASSGAGVPAALTALLDRLRLRADSQMLVFSKTSIQAARVGPRRPRAIYFDDEVSVAYVPGSPTVEIVAIDPAQGPIFYTATMTGKVSPAAPGVCLRCHQGPNTAGVPGVYVGSVIPGPTGAPLRDESAIVTDQRSPFRERWGGWYVTARQGEQPDRANAVASNPADPEDLVRDGRQNLTSLAGLIDLAAYPEATSDIVALMTFEHQTQMANLITRVGWDARIAGRDRSSPSTLDADLEDLVAYMLFAGEAPLAAPIEGVSSFARTFPERGPRDRRGRSLRDFDLHTRLFRYPLSYLIYSRAFDALPGPVREGVYRRLFDVLSGADRDARFASLSLVTRRAILEIVRDTKPGLPAWWRADR